jgi:hypothetical protein
LADGAAHRAAQEAAKKRDHVHVPGDEHDGGFGFSGGGTSSGLESGGAVAGSGAASGVPSMAVGRVGLRPRLAVVLFGPTGRTLGNSSEARHRTLLSSSFLCLDFRSPPFIIIFIFAGRDRTLNLLRLLGYGISSPAARQQTLECSPRGRALQLVAAASQRTHFMEPLAAGSLPPAALSRLKASRTAAGALDASAVRGRHHHRGGKSSSSSSSSSSSGGSSSSGSSGGSSSGADSNAAARRALWAPAVTEDAPRAGGIFNGRGSPAWGGGSTGHAATVGFEVDVYLASSPACGADWEATLARAYAPYLRQV